MKRYLIVNPGSTSTKLSIFNGMEQAHAHTINHSQEELSAFHRIVEQKDYRQAAISNYLAAIDMDVASLDGIIGIGGLLKNVLSGVYAISDDMANDLSEARYGEHAANLGALIVQSLSLKLAVPGYIADPITVDEMQEVARISGHPLLPRYGRTHTLNHKRIAMSVSDSLSKRYEDARLIIAHLGGGVSIAAHCGGKIIDSTSSRGEGAFSMDRSGGLNGWELAKLCFSGKYTKQEVLRMLNGDGGVVAYLGTRDFRDVERRMKEGDALAHQVFDGFLYQVAKEIGSMAVVLEGKLDGIVLTGGIVYSEAAVRVLREKISFLGDLILRPGEEEMESLAFYINAVTEGRMDVREYQS